MSLLCFYMLIGMNFGRNQCFGCNFTRYKEAVQRPPEIQQKIEIATCDMCHLVHVRYITTTIQAERYILVSGPGNHLFFRAVPDVTNFLHCIEPYCGFRALNESHLERHIWIVHPNIANMYFSA